MITIPNNNMLLFKIILALFAFVFSVGADTRPKVIFAPEVLQVLRGSIVKCFGETGVDPNVITLTEEGLYNTDDVFKKFVHCVYVTAKFCNSDGLVKEDEAISIFPKEYTEISKVIKSCNQLVEGNPVETTFNFFKCFQDTSPVIMGLCYEDNDKNKNVCK